MKLFDFNLPQGNSDSRLDTKRIRLLRLKSRRKTWLVIHLWLGLILGFFMAVFGLTGSILVFYAEINEWLNPKIITVAVPSEQAVYKPIRDIESAAKEAMPVNAVNPSATFPRNPEATFKLRYKLPISKDITERWEVYVNPYTAEVTGKILTGRSDTPFPFTFIEFVFELHYALFLDDNPGYLIVSAMAAFLIVSFLSGLILWWPLTGKWLNALTIKRNASTERLNFDLHKTFGFYSAVILIPVLFSGIYMDVPQHVVPVLELFSPVTYRYGFKSTPTEGPSITLTKAIEIADKRYPGGRADWIRIPDAPTDIYSVCKDGVVNPGSFINRRCVIIDRYSGKVLDVDDPAIGTAGEVFTVWQWPLHSGQAFGWTGRIIVFLSGLACPVLFVTGVIRWLQKRKNTRLKSSR
jgi:uncharacterized iron-regulated membrane protein